MKRSVLNQRLFRWGPRTIGRRLLWLLGLACTKPFAHGEEFSRYQMYQDIATVLKHAQAGGKVLSISHSEELCKAIAHREIIAANYPEHNWLSLPFADASFDCIVSDMVLEHVEGDPRLAVKESCRLLKAGGYLILTTNFLYPGHGSPYDYWRFTAEGLHNLCQGLFEVVGCGNAGNKWFLIMRWLNLHKLPVPHWRFHPLHWLACKVDPEWAMVSWIVARKKAVT